MDEVMANVRPAPRHRDGEGGIDDEARGIGQPRAARTPCHRSGKELGARQILGIDAPAVGRTDVIVTELRIDEPPGTAAWLPDLGHHMVDVPARSKVGSEAHASARCDAVRTSDSQKQNGEVTAASD